MFQAVIDKMIRLMGPRSSNEHVQTLNLRDWLQHGLSSVDLVDPALSLDIALGERYCRSVRTLESATIRARVHVMR